MDNKFSSLGRLPRPDPLSAVAGASKASNPLTAKVTAILSTSYSDVEFREALSLLDDRGIENNAKTRRQIRLDIHKEVIDSNGAIIDEFGHVAEQLRLIRAILGRLNAGYDAMKSQVISAHTGTLPVLTEAASLLQQRSQVETKQEVSIAFRDHFVMSDAEVAALTSTAEPVDDRFLQYLSKAKRITQDCEILLGFEKQTLGSDLMEQTSKNIDFGFQKLYKWVQREFKSLNLENPQMNSAIRRALRVLAERPSLFQNCLDYFAEARERILSDAFHIALTGNGSSGEEDDASLKPIDLVAHDPLRYVGDMLAWIHSAAVNEREALEVLFVAEGEELAKGMKSGRDAEIWRLVADEADKGEFNALKALNDLVDRDVAGASRVLRQRVEQVIRSNEETIMAYKLATLIVFYRVTFRKLLGLGSNLFECVQSLEKEALRQFRALVRDHIAALQVEFQQPPSELGPPRFLNDALTQLEAIIKTFESSLAASEDREGEFTNVLSEAFQPFMSGCENMAMAIELPSNAIFLINCKLAAAKILGSFDFTDREAARIREGISNEAAKLVTYQHDFFCDGSGFGPLLERGQGVSDEAEKRLSKEMLERASRQLDEFLPSALMDAMENLKHLQDLALTREITEAAANQFCEDFQTLEKLIEEMGKEGGENDESGIRSVFPRTTAEIRVLLS
ncbi:conserved oligomeric complex COG6 domain-containing protein [Hirsutella rhossiliensis]|uniref:Conserved oligomeric Golgi complex subunit 6 n=1 Tax=Hirsutella rhossiliensis TaxID=111463 RepID=A0A9P8MRM1_9HYPO|nr:conserved oligomeric complex COG6 domain-containing protein [Hirsutella rhossiliensis]KAH0957957.1 conserved oligomeric complex COG6 domain-containing protein [Hirsutella rhossiliensis]